MPVDPFFLTLAAQALRLISPVNLGFSLGLALLL